MVQVKRDDAVATRGEAAERLVVDRLRAVVDPGVLVLHHVTWLFREHGYEHEGEADVVIGDPDRGLLVIAAQQWPASWIATRRWLASHASRRSRAAGRIAISISSLLLGRAVLVTRQRARGWAEADLLDQTCDAALLDGYPVRTTIGHRHRSADDEGPTWT